MFASVEIVSRVENLIVDLLFLVFWIVSDNLNVDTADLQT